MSKKGLNSSAPTFVPRPDSLQNETSSSAADSLPSSNEVVDNHRGSGGRVTQGERGGGGRGGRGRGRGRGFEPMEAIGVVPDNNSNNDSNKSPNGGSKVGGSGKLGSKTGGHSSPQKYFTCVICANDKVEYLAVGECEHHVCSLCAMRIRTKTHDR